MNGISFNDIHSYTDLGLILSPFTPTPAEPQTNFLTVPGRDGYLDLTEANGEVKFKSRTFKFTFTVVPGDEMTFDERFAMVSNALNGLRCKITLDRDPNYYWVGRCSVDKYEQDKNIGRVVVKATVNPYKLKQVQTSVSLELTGEEQTITLENSRMAAVPTIECTDDDVVIVFGGAEHTLAAGTNLFLGIRLVEGSNDLTVTGTGTITFTWQEGVL